MGRQWSDGYSSDVEICLLVDGRRFAIAQIGPEWFILRDEVELSQTLANIAITIDGQPRILDVVLYEGAQGGGRAVHYSMRSFHAGADAAKQPA